MRKDQGVGIPPDSNLNGGKLSMNQHGGKVTLCPTKTLKHRRILRRLASQDSGHIQMIMPCQTKTVLAAKLGSCQKIMVIYTMSHSNR